MSAFDGKADMAFCGGPLLRSLLGVKRTCLVALHMSAFDPKRTSTSSGWLLQVGTLLFYERRGGDEATPIHTFARRHVGVAGCGACAAIRNASDRACVSAAQWTDRMVGFHRGLGETGFTEGRNVTIEYRRAEGQFDRLPGMAADLVGRKVAVICAGAGDVAIGAAMAATKTTPIVFTTASDPVRAGFVLSLSRPGGNVTGATFMGAELVAKRLELLHEILPGITRIALLVNPNNPGLMQDNIELSKAAAQRLGLELIVVKAGSEGRSKAPLSTPSDSWPKL
jgi:ABC transporter substrate binding protein